MPARVLLLRSGSDGVAADRAPARARAVARLCAPPVTLCDVAGMGEEAPRGSRALGRDRPCRRGAASAARPARGRRPARRDAPHCRQISGDWTMQVDKVSLHIKAALLNKVGSVARLARSSRAVKSIAEREQ